MKTSNGRLPIKWSESLTTKEYTSKSDVWSYGILLYEIITLGCTPYIDIPVEHLFEYLNEGNRMAKPDNCNEEFYKLMIDCWDKTPEKRPTFDNLSQKIESFLHHQKKCLVFDNINCANSLESMQINCAFST